MARKRKSKIREGQVQGLKYLNQLSPLFEELHEVGTTRDRASNRQLHMDQYCAMILLFMFNPIVDSLRALQQASELKQVQKKLGCGRASLGSLSESVQVFDPERLRSIIAELGEKLPTVRDVGKGYVPHDLIAVDGSVVKTLSTITEAMYSKNRFGEPLCGWRLHTQFHIDRHVPTRIDATVGMNSGDADEKNVLRANLAPDNCYVMDRWYFKCDLFNEINAIGSSYVCRVRDNSNLTQVIEERALTEAAHEAGVLSDTVLRLGTRANSRGDHPVRIIQVTCSPHTKRGRRHGGQGGPPSDGVLRIATNLLDVPAEIISDIFRHRWMIETFFKFFKHILGCRHLLSQNPNGIKIEAYCAIIACMLISLWTGRKPSKRTYEMICYYFIGWATEEEVLKHLEKLPTHP